MKREVATRAEPGFRMPPADWSGNSEWPACAPTRFGPPTPIPLAAPDRGAPPSVRRILTSLVVGPIRSTGDLQAQTGLPARTVRHALRWLSARGYLERRTSLQDARRSRVRLLECPQGLAVEATGP